MKPQLFPNDQTFWYLKPPKIQRLMHDSSYDVAIIGGGMAGLSAAQSFLNKGLRVVLLEKTVCGAGASGKSSGFITPDSEISLNGFIELYGQDNAHIIWDLGTQGVTIIKNNIEQYATECDYQIQDTLIVANTLEAFNDTIEKEYRARNLMNLSSTLYNQEQLTTILKSPNYFGGIKYGATFGINAYKYCQSIKEVLQDLGADIYEETPVIEVNEHKIVTTHATIQANYIVFCVDKWLPDFNHFNAEIYPVQSFIMLSASLTDAQVAEIFPQDPCMVWDTDLIYTYFRLVGNNRLLVGGSNLFSAYAGKAQHDNTRIIKQFNNYIKNKFPHTNITFEYLWPGLIGTTKDFAPLAGLAKGNDYTYYIGGAAGLPWAAALGNYSADKLIDNKTDYDHYFSPYREFPVGSCIQSLIGKRLTFALSSYLAINN